MLPALSVPDIAKHVLKAESSLCPRSSSFELQYGVERSAYKYANQQRLERFLRGPIEILPLTDQDARTAGMIRASLEKSKQPIGPYDTLIAGQALARGLTLVTSNVAEFSRVEGLRWEDWSSAPEIPLSR